MNTKFLGVTLATLAMACGCAPGDGPFPAPDVERFEATLDATIAAQGSPGALMLVRDGSGRRWAGVRGVVDRDTSVAVTEDTVFRTASVGKTFTGAVILALHDEGRIAVTDPIADYVEGVTGGEEITLAMLLNHTSGVPNYTQVAAYRARVLEDPTWRPTTAELITLALGDPPVFPPGTGWDYSNTGYLLLGRVVEVVTGSPIEVEVRRRFFDPLGMHETRPAEERAGRVWTGYRSLDGALVETPYDGGPLEDGAGWVTTLHDLEIWARQFLGGRLHRPETLALARMTEGGALLDSVAQAFGLESGGYGLGFIAARDAALGPLYAGAGNGDGARTFVGFLPDADTAFVVAVNVGDGAVPLVETLSASGPLIDALRATH